MPIIGFFCLKVINTRGSWEFFSLHIPTLQCSQLITEILKKIEFVNVSSSDNNWNIWKYFSLSVSDNRNITQFNPASFQTQYSLVLYSIQPRSILNTASFHTQCSLVPSSIQPRSILNTASFHTNTASFQPKYSLVPYSIQPRSILNTASFNP